MMLGYGRTGHAGNGGSTKLQFDDYCIGLVRVTCHNSKPRSYGLGTGRGYRHQAALHLNGSKLSTMIICPLF
jgi:hypothetical protein